MDVTIEYLTCATFEKFVFLTDMCSFCWQKCEPRPKLFLRLDIFSTFRSVPTLIFTYVSYIVIGLHEEPENFYREKRSVALTTGDLFTFFGGFISRRFGDYANINMWKSDYAQTWNSIKNDYGRFNKNQLQWPLCLKQKIARNGQGIFDRYYYYRYIRIIHKQIATFHLKEFSHG